MFQIPVGPHPFPPGTLVVSGARPWFGVGVVEPVDERSRGRFSVRWSDHTITRGQVPEMQYARAP